MNGTTIQLRVRYSETDQMAVANHSHYFPWFELARTEWLRQRGVTYKQLESEGLALPVLKAEACFKHSACYDDLLEVAAVLAAYCKTRCVFRYRIWRGGQLLTEGLTEHAFVVGRRPAALPKVKPQLDAILRGALEEHALF